MGDLMSVTEVMKRLELSRATVIRCIGDGRLRGERIGNSWVVFADSVEAFVQATAGAEGFLTVNEAAAELGISGPLVHHHLKTGKLKGEKTPEGWRITAEEVKRFAAEPRKIGRPPVKGTSPRMPKKAAPPRPPVKAAPIRIPAKKAAPQRPPVKGAVQRMPAQTQSSSQEPAGGVQAQPQPTSSQPPAGKNAATGAAKKKRGGLVNAVDAAAHRFFYENRKANDEQAQAAAEEQFADPAEHRQFIEFWKKTRDRVAEAEGAKFAKDLDRIWRD